MSILESLAKQLNPNVFRCPECDELNYAADFEKEMVGTALDAYHCPDCGERVFV